MERLTQHTSGNRIIKLGDLFDINGTKLMVKELFILNNQTYITYDVQNQEGLVIELVDKFITEKDEYFNTVVPNPIADAICGLRERG
jgi:hypothetical protein